MNRSKQEPGKPTERARRKTTLALGRVLPGLLPTATGEAAVLAQLSGQWGALCPVLAAWSYPTKLVKGVLHVAVVSDSVKQEIGYLTPQIMHGARMLLGYDAIHSVRASSSGWGSRVGRQSLKPQALSKEEIAKAEARCKNVADDDLRATLARLGAWAARQNHQPKN